MNVFRARIAAENDLRRLLEERQTLALQYQFFSEKPESDVSDSGISIEGHMASLAATKIGIITSRIACLEVRPLSAPPRILIVDDDRLTRKFIGAQLENNQHVYEEVDNGPAAIERIKSGGIQLILLDYLMPGMTGIEVLKAMKRLDISIPVIMMSAETDAQLMTEVFDLGAVHFLTKPLEVNRIIATIQKTVRFMAAKNQATSVVARFRLLIESGHRIYWSISDMGRVEYVSPAFQKVWESSIQEMHQDSRFWMQIIHPEDLQNTKDLYEAWIAGDGGFDTEFRIVTQCLETKWVHTHGERLLYSDGRVELCIIAEDITERKNTEIRLKEIEVARIAAEHVMAMTLGFVSNMSHELRTPLHAMLAFAKYGVDRFGLSRFEGILAEPQKSVEPAKLFEYFREIHAAGTRLLTLVDSLLDLSKLQSGITESVFQRASITCIIDLVRSEIAGILESGGISLDIRIDPEVHEIFLDHEKIVRVLINLLSNAVKFTSPGGVIEIEVRNGSMDLNARPVSTMDISVRDHGPGIPPEDQARIFDKFVQLSQPSTTFQRGTGLGLSIVQEIIRLHSGIISVANHPEGGTVFQFSLPYVQHMQRE